MSEGAWAGPLGWQGLQVDQTQRVGLPQAYPGTMRLESPCPSCAFQHYSDERHSHGGPPERHARDSRDGWGGYGSDKRMSEGRGPPPPPRLAGRPRQASLGASLPSLGPSLASVQGIQVYVPARSPGTVSALGVKVPIAGLAAEAGSPEAV